MPTKKNAWEIAMERERNINGSRSHFEPEFKTATTYDRKDKDKLRKHGTISPCTKVQIPREYRAELRAHNKRKKLENVMDCREVDKFFPGERTFTPAPEKKRSRQISLKEFAALVPFGAEPIYDGTRYQVFMDGHLIGHLDKQTGDAIQLVAKVNFKRQGQVQVNAPSTAQPVKRAAHSVTHPEVDTAVKAVGFVAVFENESNRLGFDKEAEQAKAQAKIAEQIKDIPVGSVWRYLVTGQTN